MGFGFWNLRSFILPSLKNRSNASFHIAIILDGNRRWARKRGLPRIIGHKKGADNLKRLLPTFIENKVTHLSVYALSTENISERNQAELKSLFREIEKLSKDISIFHDNGIRLRVFGDIRKFPTSAKKVIKKLVYETREHKNLNLNLALGYGSRDEILRAIKKLKKSGQAITEKKFNLALDSGGQPDPDLLIRPGGKSRLSNFLLWQLAYAELYFTDKLWPEFDENELKKAIMWFQDQQRNFGR